MVKNIKRDRSDIFGMPILGFLFKNSKFLMALRILVAVIFFYAIYYGFAHPEKKVNLFTTAVFWGVFWALFMVITLPTFGRIFCGICPHGFLGKYITRFGLKKRLPKFLENRYIGISLIVFIWWGLYYTFSGLWYTPYNTALMFGSMTLFAFVIYFIYKDMSYCKYFCPIGTLTRAYDKLAFTKLETYGSECKDCRTFECADACEYSLKPFTFEKKNQADDCTLCMDCATACDAVKFSITKPAEQLNNKLKILKAEVWTYILILGSIPVSMTFAHGLGRSKISDELIWSQTASFFGVPEYWGGFAFLYAILFTSILAVSGLFLASKILKTDFNSTFTNLGVAFVPLFIFGSLGHTLETFFVKDYQLIVEGFAQGLFLDVEVEPLAKRGDEWLHLFSLLKWVGVAWSFLLIYKRLKLVTSSVIRKTFAFFSASLLLFGFFGMNIYKSHIIDTYGVKERGHSHSSHSSTKEVEKTH